MNRPQNLVTGHIVDNSINLIAGFDLFVRSPPSNLAEEQPLQQEVLATTR
jgi:hypothetical protein